MSPAMGALGHFGGWLRNISAAILLLVPAAATPPRAQTAPVCAFNLGFAALHGAIPAIVGQCTENEHYSSSGDSQQRTTNGLLVWRKADGWSAFTDGSRTWVAGPFGLQERLNTQRFPWEANPRDAGVTVAPAPSAASLGPVRFVRQSLNDCGPAAISSLLDYWGVSQTEAQAEAVLRADNYPDGMVAFGLPGYARGLGLATFMGVNGTEKVVQTLVANGFPVMVDQWVSLDQPIDHYRIVEAYDAGRRTFLTSDPLLGPDREIGFDEFSQTWQADHRRFYVLYPPQDHALLAAIFRSAGWDPIAAFQADAVESHQDATNHPELGFGPGYDHMDVAWAELELNELGAARDALRAAQAQGANPVRLAWISAEIDLRQTARVFW